MTTQSALIEEAVQGALKDIEKYGPSLYGKLNADPARKAEVMQAARETAVETLKLTEELRGKSDNIAEILGKHLSKERIQLIQGALEIPTFRMAIERKTDGKHQLVFTRDNKEFQPSRAIISAADIDWGTTMQYASILIEAVLLVMSAVGVSVSVSSSVMKKTVDDVADAITRSSALRRALDDFVSAWNKADGSTSKAKALFYLIKDSYSAGILWTIIKSLCSNMSWFDWAKTAAKISAMLIAALATSGIALIAKIALVVLSAVDFAFKISNVVQLSEMKAAL